MSRIGLALVALFAFAFMVTPVVAMTQDEKPAATEAAQDAPKPEAKADEAKADQPAEDGKKEESEGDGGGFDFGSGGIGTLLGLIVGLILAKLGILPGFKKGLAKAEAQAAPTQQEPPKTS